MNDQEKIELLVKVLKKDERYKGYVDEHLKNMAIYTLNKIGEIGESTENRIKELQAKLDSNSISTDEELELSHLTYGEEINQYLGVDSSWEHLINDDGDDQIPFVLSPEQLGFDPLGE